MRALFENPFHGSDPDRKAIWTMLVERDIDAFLAADWEMVRDDFIGEGFLGIDGRHMDNPDCWRLTFPTIEAYRDYWLKQAKEFQVQQFDEDPRAALFAATSLQDIEIKGNLALVHKKFDGSISRSDGSKDILNWQSLFHCRRIDERWKITGFNGYLPNPVGTGKT